MKQSFFKIYNKIKEDETLVSLNKGLFISFGGQILAFIFATLLHILFARAAGPSNYGIYAYASSWILLFALISKFGFGSALMRFIAAYEAKKDWALLKGIIIRSHQFSFSINLVFGSAIVIVFFLLKGETGLNITSVLIPAMFLGIAMTHLQLISSTLLGLRQVFLAKFISPVFRPVILSIVLGGFLLFPEKKVTGLDLIAFDAVATSLLVFVSAFFLYKKIPVIVRSTKAHFQSREWVSVTFPLFLLGLVQVAITQTDILMLGSLSGLKNAGIYNAVTKISFILTYMLISVNVVIAPLISRFYSLGEITKIKKIFRFIRILLATLSVPAAVALIIFSDLFLSVFGDDFSSGASALKIVVLGKLVSVIAGPVGFLYTMTDNHIIALKVFGFSAVLNIVLNYYFIKLWGINGAALASTITLIFWNVILITFSKKKFGCFI
ncbi:MAG: oligosaccharide flippase family protein [Acidobacteriota bacterium]